MRVNRLLGLVIGCLGYLSWSPASAALADLEFDPPTIDAESYVLLEALTGEVIAQKNPDKELPPASLVKLMTAYLAFSAVDEGLVTLDELVIVSKNARDAIGSRMFLEVNTQVSFEALLYGLIVQSGNDAAIAIAERIAGSEEAFADLMNQQAAQLGMTNSYFASATGLPKPKQLATARDLAILSRHLAKDYPQLYQIHAVREFEHNGILQKNRNRLLDEYTGTDGLKTGYTRTAKYCLAASAVRHGMRLVGVVLGSRTARTRAREMEALFNFGFNNYRSVELFTPGQNLDQVRVWGGASEKVAVGYGQDEPLRLLLSRGQANSLKAVLKSSTQPIEAPVTRGDEIASIIVKADEEELVRIPAVALGDVSPGSWWVRVVDYVRLHWLAPSTPPGTVNE